MTQDARLGGTQLGGAQLGGTASTAPLVGFEFGSTADLVRLGIPPSNPVGTSAYFDTTLGKVGYWDGSAWQYVPGTGGGGPNPVDAFSLGLTLADTNNAPSDAATFLLGLLGTDSNAAPTDTLQLNIKGLGDANTAPTDSRSVTVRVWLSGTTMDSTNGVTGPANANGQNDAAVATYTSAVAGDANPRTHSALGANIGTISFTTAVFTGWFKSVNVLMTSTTKLVMHSTTAAFADITMFSNVALNTTVDHSTGDFTFDLVAAGVNTLAKLQSCQLLASTNDAAAGVTPAVLTVDACAVDIAGVF